MVDEVQGKQEKQERPQAVKNEEQSIIRIAGKDINGSYRIVKALNQVKGIGLNLADAIATVAEKKFSISRDSRIGSLSEDQISQLESIIKAPDQNGVPSFMVNRRRDFGTNTNMHLVGSDLTVRVKQDIDADVRIQTWRGFRHQYGQKVRGQRTRSTGRTGETIGVMKKTIAAAQKAAEAQEKTKEEKK